MRIFASLLVCAFVALTLPACSTTKMSNCAPAGSCCAKPKMKQCAPAGACCAKGSTKKHHE